MVDFQYEKICYRTQQQEEHVPVKNVKTGEIGFTYLCTEAGKTIQVRLENGDLDTWDREDCVPVGEDAAGTSSDWDKNDVFPEKPLKPALAEDSSAACTSERHDQHMCELKKRGEFETMKKLSADPMMECARCGARSANPENLCEPAQYPDVTDVGDTYEKV